MLLRSFSQTQSHSILNYITDISKVLLDRLSIFWVRNTFLNYLLSKTFHQPLSFPEEGEEAVTREAESAHSNPPYLAAAVGARRLVAAGVKAGAPPRLGSAALALRPGACSGTQKGCSSGWGHLVIHAWIHIRCLCVIVCWVHTHA